MPKHRAGEKIAGKHTTLIDAAVPVVDALLSCPEVTKVVLGPIKNQVGKTNESRLKFTEIPAGWQVLVRGMATVQTLYVYTGNRQKVKDLAEGVFSNGNGKKRR